MSDKVRLNNNHWIIGSFVEVVTTKQLRSIALDHDTIMRNGTLCDLKTKRIAPGVYRIWYEARTYSDD